MIMDMTVLSLHRMQFVPILTAVGSVLSAIRNASFIALNMFILTNGVVFSECVLIVLLATAPRVSLFDLGVSWKLLIGR